MATHKAAATSVTLSCEGLKVLQARDVAIIEEAIDKVGLFGEVHLVIEHGRLRHVRTIRSEMIGNEGPRLQA